MEYIYNWRTKEYGKKAYEEVMCTRCWKKTTKGIKLKSPTSHYTYILCEECKNKKDLDWSNWERESFNYESNNV